MRIHLQASVLYLMIVWASSCRSFYPLWTTTSLVGAFSVRRHISTRQRLFATCLPLLRHEGTLISYSSTSQPRQQRQWLFSASSPTKITAGEQDAEQENETVGKKTKTRQQQQQEQLYRADRVLANRTGKSRSECFELLKQKRVWQQKDNQQRVVVPGPSTKLAMDAPLWLDRTLPIPLPPPLIMVYHKPKWVLSVRHDPHDRPCLSGLLPQMHPVGRLDYDTSGLLLFSSSGPLTQHLLHPKHEITKEYIATVAGRVDSDALQQQLTEGVETTEGIHTAQLQSVEHLPQTLVADYLGTIRAGLPAEYNQTDLELRGYLKVLTNDTQQLSTVRLTVTEGKHRMVRRILANCGHAVVSLQRIALGEIILNDDLEPGQTRELTSGELAWVESLLPRKPNNKKYVAKHKRHGRRNKK